MKVIYKKEYNPYTKQWNILAIFPELEANYGRLQCFCREEGWNECTYDYYWKCKSTKAEEYAELHEYLQAEFDEPLEIRKRISTKMYDELCAMWRKSIK